MQILMRKTSELIPYINNPRDNANAVDAVASSIKNYGFKVPIIIDKENEIVTGHTRLLAAKKLGLEEVPCIIADDLTQAQIKAFRIADNKVAEASEWNLEMLAVELQDLEGFTGFDAAELEDLFPKDENEIVEDEAPEPPEKPISRLGDVWLLGRHKVLCGDSTLVQDVEKLMDGVKADMVLTDPPYNVAYEGGTKDKLTIKNDSMDNDSFRIFLKDAFFAANESLKPGGAFYIWHADSEGYNFRGACLDVGWKVRQCLIWAKNSLVMGRQDYQWKHEPCLYGWKEGSAHLWAADRKQTTIINFDKPTKNACHPTMKPVGIFDYLIKNNTKGEDIVLDVFMGSGTTIIACEQNGRIGYGVELDEKYVDVIVQRYINLVENDENVYLIRDGEKIAYKDIAPEHEIND